MNAPRCAPAPAGNRGEVPGGKHLSKMQFTAGQLSLLDRHGAIVAADAAPAYLISLWQDAIRRAAREGGEFSADDLQERFNLPDLSSPGAIGGLFLRAHRRGLIRRVGYRCSRKASRAGAAIAVWQGVAR